MSTSKIKKAYDFFCVAELQNLVFSLEDICEHTGWAVSTVGDYRTKKWGSFLVEDKDGFFTCKGMIDFPYPSFERLYRQKIEITPLDYRPFYTDEINIYLEKSRESVQLAIQIYNNPIAKFRTEGYLVQMIIGLTMLFHAIFEKKGLEYWYKDPESGEPQVINGEKKYWEITKCANEYYKGMQTPELENIKFCAEIRNKIEHRYFVNLDLNLSGYSQSLLNNYETILIKEFGNYFSLGDSHTLLALQISNFSKNYHENINKLYKKNYEEISEFIQRFNRDLPIEFLSSDRFNFKAFLIPKLGNHATSSDVSIEFVNYDSQNPEEMEKYKNMVAFIKERKISVNNPDMYLPSIVVKKVQEIEPSFNMHLHTRAWKYFKVRPTENSPIGCNADYCVYNEPVDKFVYTKKWVEFLIDQVSNHDLIESLRKFHP